MANEDLERLIDAIGGQFENGLGFVPLRGVIGQTANVGRAFRSAFRRGCRA